MNPPNPPPPNKADCISVPVTLLRHFCDAFLQMRMQGAQCSDPTLFEDLDKVIASHERKKG